MHDEDRILVERIRGMMSELDGYSEKKMFGGVCFMLDGNMCVGPWKGSLIVRLSKEQHESTQREPHTALMDITGKVMKGWARIKPRGIASDEALQRWIDRAVDFVRTLPPK